jgi:hypothetical protein
MTILKDINKVIKAFEKIDRQRKREAKSRDRMERKAEITRQKVQRQMVAEARNQEKELQKFNEQFRESYVIQIRVHVDPEYPWGEHAV